MLRTGLKEFPRPSGRSSRYDGLLEVVDQDVVALIRGEDFDEHVWHDSVRSELVGWARSRGVKIATRVSWRHPTTGEPSPFERDGKPLPYAVYVQVRSLNGSRAMAGAKTRSKGTKAKRRPKRAGAG